MNVVKYIRIGSISKLKPHAEGLENDHFHSCVALHGYNYHRNDGTVKKVFNVTNNCCSSYFTHIIAFKVHVSLRRALK